MASTNKNLIQSLRSAHDPHFKLEGRVEGLEKNIPIQIAELHKTLSKSFGMQRKTLMRVLGLEKKLAELEASKAAQQEEEQQEIEDVIDDVQDAVDQVEDTIDEEIPEQLDNVLDDIRGEEEEIGSDDAAEITPPTSTTTKPKPKRKRLRIRKTKISGEDLKKGSSQETETGEQKKISSEDLKKGSSQETVEKIESRVFANEKKIELVKNILKAQKSDLAEKLRSLEPEPESESESEQKQMSSPLLETLQAIAATTDSIRDTLIQKQDFDEDIREDMRIAGEKADADKQEKGLENTKPKPLTKLGEKIIAPVTSIFGKIFNFIKTLILGKFLMNFIDWFANPANQGKIQSFVKFIGDWWPALTAAVLLFGTGFTGLVAGLVKVIVFGVTKLLGLIPLLKAALVKVQAGKLLSLIPGGKMVKGALLLGGTALTAYGVNKVMTNDEDMEEFGEGVQEFNKGGQVRGSGNKDTVPAMLTPGEFVMSKGAVQKYGTNTMEAMNAAAGGTNRPTLMGRYNEGGVVTDPKERQQQEAYMLKYVNEERAMQGLEPLINLTYAPGVELTKMMGPGPKTKEISNTITDLDRGITTKTKSRTVDGKTEIIGKIGQSTDEEREKFFAENPHAAQLVNLKDQAELDSLGADISASAKMNGGGLVQGFQGGGLVTVKPGTINSYQDAINAGIEVEDIVTGGKRFGEIWWREKHPKSFFGLGKQKYTLGGTKWYISGVGSGAAKELAMSTEDYVNMKMGWSGASSAKVESVKPKDSSKSSKSGGRVRGKSKMYNIKSKEPKNTIVAYEQEANKNQQKTAPASGGNEIPSFDVAPIRDPMKMMTLQIVLF